MTTVLYRPVGPQELQLVRESGSTAFPPRLPGQPIFYPVLNEEYAEQIARGWNAADAATGYREFVTRFRVETSYLDGFEPRQVGGAAHWEYWIPAEQLAEFNARIVGGIEVATEFRSRPRANGPVERIPWRPPWASIEGDPRTQDALDAELAREIPRGHVIEGHRARAIGRRDDCDDVLFALDGPGPGYAVVHLTWRRGRETDRAWPATELFDDAAGLVARRLEPDAGAVSA